MIEKTYQITQTDERIIEKVIIDDLINYSHAVIPAGESIPEHYTDSNVYMLVVRGKVTLKLKEQLAQTYSKGTIIYIPKDTKMFVYNVQNDVLEFTVVKAPAPQI